ncbi:putative DUF4148 domain-containing protein [Gammaproteobacteria bacterium]
MIKTTLCSMSIVLATTMAMLTPPVMAQQPPASAMAPQAPASQPANKPVVKPRNLMTAQEKQAYHREMQQARTLQEKQQIMDEKRSQLRQRATERGMVMAEPTAPRGNPALRPEARAEKPMALRPMSGGAK